MDGKEQLDLSNAMLVTLQRLQRGEGIPRGIARRQTRRCCKDISSVPNSCSAQLSACRLSLTQVALLNSPGHDMVAETCDHRTKY